MSLRSVHQRPGERRELQPVELSMEDSLVRAIQKVFGSENEDYTEDTILDSDINQIRHLFYWLRSERRLVLIHYGAEAYRARVSDVGNVRAVLRVNGFREEQARRCRIKFEIVNILYQFEVPILDIAEDRVEIRIPAFIQSAKRRQQRRIPTDDMFMRFGLLYQPIFGARGAGQIVESRYPHIVRELQNEEPDLYIINRIITEEIAKISPDFEFRFYPQDHKKNLMEQMVGEEKKTLYLRDAHRLQTYYERQTLYGLINYHRRYQAILRDDDEEAAIRFFEQVQHKDQERFIGNYVCAPLLIFDEVIGHIYVYNSIFDRRYISYDEAYHIDLLAQLLNYAMSRTVIARTYYRHTYTRVVNISMGGLLFELQNRTIFDYLTFHDQLTILIQIRYHVLNLKAEIQRIFPAGEGFNIGVRFFHAGPDDYRVLENFIYERSRQTFE